MEENKTKNPFLNKVDLPTVKKIIAVSSGKGGVGKSTVAANLAISMQQQGNNVALVDADIYGPSIPTMFGVDNERPATSEKEGKPKMIPLERHGIKLISIGFLMDPGHALIWRGPMASGAITQLFQDTDWGDIDVMIVDLPPGTGDIHLTLVQKLDLNGAIIVTTPQKLAVDDVRKSANMFSQDKINVPLIGFVENMAYFIPAEHPDEKYFIFGKGGGALLSKESNVPVLCQIPIIQSICDSGDNGHPAALDSNKIVQDIFKQLAGDVSQWVSDN